MDRFVSINASGTGLIGCGTHNHRLARFLAALALLLLIAGCGSSDDDNSRNESAATPTPEVDATTILQDASTRISQTQTMKFTLEISGTTMIDDSRTIQLLGARGSLERPGKVDVQFQVRVLGTQTASIRMISAGGQSWTTDLITGNWGPAPEEFGYDPALLFDTQNGLGPVMGKVTAPELIGSEDIDGRTAWHIHGTVTQAVIGPITAGTMHGDPVSLDLWIDANTSDLLKIQLAEPPDSGNDDPATWTMSLRAHDDPVTIEPPA
jgi:hypothetical protein